MMEKIEGSLGLQAEIKRNIEKLEEQIEQKKQAKINLAMELVERKDGFPFPGIVPDRYKNMKNFEREYPGLSTPIDEQMERFTKEEMKIVFGMNPESGNVFILPMGSDDINKDSIAPRILQADKIVDKKLKMFVLMEQEFESLCQQQSSLQKQLK